MKTSLIIKTIFLLTCISPLLGQAQDTTGVEVPLIKDVQVDFSLGYLKNRHGSLNNTLKENGWGAVSENLLTYSASARAFRGRFLFGFEWMGYTSLGSEENEDLQASLKGYYVEPYIGYTIVQKNNFRLYPFVGLNSSFATLKLEDLSPAVAFDDVWSDPRRGGIVDFNSYALDIGVHMLKLIPVKNRRWDCPQNNKYISVGFKVGYYLNLAEGENGRYNGQRFSDSPSFGINGFYGKMTIGFGTQVRKVKWR